MVSVSMQQVGMLTEKQNMETAYFKKGSVYVCCHCEIQFVYDKYSLV